MIFLSSPPATCLRGPNFTTLWRTLLYDRPTPSHSSLRDVDGGCVDAVSGKSSNWSSKLGDFICDYCECAFEGDVRDCKRNFIRFCSGESASDGVALPHLGRPGHRDGARGRYGYGAAARGADGMGPPGLISAARAHLPLLRALAEPLQPETLRLPSSLSRMAAAMEQGVGGLGEAPLSLRPFAFSCGACAWRMARAP